MANLIGHRGEMLAEDRGMTPARKKFIQDHRKYADTHGPSLPYEIGLFKAKLGNKRRDIEVVCSCGKTMWVSKITCGVVCPSCQKFHVVQDNG